MNICDNGLIDCATGLCTDELTANAAQTGVTCGTLATCQGTQCLQANWPIMPNYEGGVLATPNLVLMTYSDDPNATNEEHDAEWVVGDGYLPLVAGQYGVGNGTSQVANLGPVASAPTGTNTNYNAFPEYFETLFDAGTIPPYAPENFYVLYLPSAWADSAGFCQDQGGYHTSYQDNDGNNVVYAIIPNCLGQQQGYLQEIEFAATHEIVEGSTDPLGDSWVFVDPNNASSYLGGEVADMCENYDVFVDGGGIYVAPVIWSNSAITAGQVPCQPWPAGTAYVSVLAPPTMAVALPGTAAQVTVTGWASAPYAPWGVQAIDDPVGYSDYATNPSLGAVPADGGSCNSMECTLSPGQQISVTMNVPSSALGGQGGAVWVACYDENSDQDLGAAMVGVVAGCTESAFCQDPQTLCDSDGGAVGYCGENYCAGNAAPFSVCSSQGTDDGVCIPNDFGNGPVELCNQAGSLPTGAVNCAQYSRTGDGGTADYCSTSSYCFGINTPTCLGLCAYDGGAGGCTSGDDCVQLGTYFGVCSADCTVTQACPAGQTCYSISDTQSACLP
jgi:hypothetical protein